MSESISFGCVLATVVSYVTNLHMGWAVLHGLLGWVYVGYRALGYGA